MVNNSNDTPQKVNPLLTQLAQELKSTVRKDNSDGASSRFALFLGAGASFSSGIKIASGMIEHFRKRIYERYNATFENENDEMAWLKDQKWYRKKGSHYSKLFEECYKTEKDRRSYIESIIANAEPSFGYMVLANLIQEGYFSTIITTNFDDLVYIACTTFTSIRPVVYALGGFATEMTLNTERPRVLKIHGDFLYSKLKNTGPELQYQDQTMAKEVHKILENSDGVIVVGYSGGDESVMNLLKSIPKDKKIYWCYLKGSWIPQSVKNLIKNEAKYLVEIDGFDELMNSLRNYIGLTNKDLVNQLEKNFRKAFQIYQKPKDQVSIEFIAELAQSLKILGLHAEANKAINEGDDKELERLVEKVLAIEPDNYIAQHHKGLLLYRQGKYQESLDCLENLDQNHRFYINRLCAISAVHKRLGNQNKLQNCLTKISNVIKPDAPNDWYNLACYYAVQEKNDEAINFLIKAINSNSSYKYWASKDIEFDWMRGNKRFNEIIDQ